MVSEKGDSKKTVKRKRGPKKKKKDDASKEKKIPKKRGRKPKGGKIISSMTEKENVIVVEPNIILHLKCGEEDLKKIGFFSNEYTEYDPGNISKIDSYNFDNEDSIKYSVVETRKIQQKVSKKNDKESEKEDIRDVIAEKLKQLTIDLHCNNISDKKSACFYCTCEFDNPPIYIPKHQLNGTYEVYGCFCSPECACGYLFKQANLNTSTKFERYHLLNNIYCKIYDYKRNIKPAPNPYYTLDKFYGNLNIQEYRQLLKNERVLLVVDKPLSRSLPELHEDNGEFMINNRSLSENNTYKLKRSKKRQTKSEILMSNFNLK